MRKWNKKLSTSLKKLAHEHNKCVIVVTHSNEIAQQSDQIFSLKKGVLVPYE